MTPAPRPGSEDSAVKVIVRVRPFLSHEQLRGGESPPTPVVVQGPSQLFLQERVAKTHRFNFTRVLGPEAEQAAVYSQSVRPVVGKFLEGFNATIFAYGQTGSGKTHTMMGTVATDASGATPARTPRTPYNPLDVTDARHAGSNTATPSTTNIAITTTILATTTAAETIATPSRIPVAGAIRIPSLTPTVTSHRNERQGRKASAASTLEDESAFKTPTKPATADTDDGAGNASGNEWYGSEGGVVPRAIDDIFDHIERASIHGL